MRMCYSHQRTLRGISLKLDNSKGKRRPNCHETLSLIQIDAVGAASECFAAGVILAQLILYRSLFRHTDSQYYANRGAPMHAGIPPVSTKCVGRAFSCANKSCVIG